MSTERVEPLGRTVLKIISVGVPNMKIKEKDSEKIPREVSDVINYQNRQTSFCNCTRNKTCLLDLKCKTKIVVYICKVTPKSRENFYISSSSFFSVT